MKNTAQDLTKIAHDIRVSIVKMVHAAGSGHPAGALGITDVMAALYFQHMLIDPERPQMEERDRFVLSAAHMVPVLYATLAERGFFPKSELLTLRQFGSRMQGHTFRNLEIGVETTGGSLGQGISIALGFALAAKLRRREGLPSFHTYCVIGDGESDEGQIWEAALFAAKYKLDNLTVILDRNNIQQSGTGTDIMPLDPVANKWEAFGWKVFQIDGHDFSQINFALDKARLVPGQPSLVMANTIAGKGVSFMENNYQWHGKAPNDEELKQALKELEANG
jgi:transketolase